MATNNFEIEINSTLEKVWLALTNSVEFTKWMKNVEVQSDWQKGSEITYTCFDESGKVMQWDGMDMIWKGNIKTIEENKELTCVYPNKSTGLMEESYFLKKMSDYKTKLIQVQKITSQKVADGYKDGTAHTHKLLKNYLEKNSEYDSD